jgi:hypothetical protein
MFNLYGISTHNPEKINSVHELSIVIYITVIIVINKFLLKKRIT